MAIPPRPTIRTLPTAPDVSDPGTFSDRAAAWAPELGPFGGEVGQVADWTGDRADAAKAAQEAAETAQGAAETAQGAAEGARDTALAHRDDAETAKTQAETAAAAAGAAAGLPSLAGNAGRVLTVAAGEGGVEWAQGVGYQELTSSGTWTKATGVTWVVVELVAGGTSGQARIGGSASGGAGGDFAYRVFAATDLPATVAVTVGAGGASPSATGPGAKTAAANAGGATTFGAFLSTADGGKLGGSAQAPFYGAAPGGVAFNPPGNAGGKSMAHGAGGNGVAVNSGNAVGGAGQFPGGGGGGANITDTATTGTATGGAGAPGVARIWQG